MTDEVFRKYGCKLVGQEPTDIKYRLGAPIALPSSFAMTTGFPPIYDQGATGSCTGNAWAAAFSFQAYKQGILNFDPSRLFIYYNERILEGTTASDSGAQVKSGADALNRWGALSESLWAFLPSNLTVVPPPVDYITAHANILTDYKFVNQDLISIKTALFNNHPIVFGFTVYEGFESTYVARTGEMSMPGWGESVVGGHCVVAIGWNDENQTILCRNSWGSNWGKNGLFMMPYRYILDPKLATDFWVILKED